MLTGADRVQCGTITVGIVAVGSCNSEAVEEGSLRASASAVLDDAMVV